MAQVEILHLPHGRRARSDEWVVLHGTYHPPPGNYEVHEDDTMVTLSQFAEREGLHRDSLRMTMLQHINRGRHTPYPRFGTSLYLPTLSLLHCTPRLLLRSGRPAMTTARPHGSQLRCP